MTADDCILYRTISCEQDHLQLQSGLYLIVKWTEVWQMGLNISKCAILTCRRLLSSSSFAYTINVLLICFSAPLYHIWFRYAIHSSHRNITLKSTKMLNFIRWNLYNCTMNTKRMAFISMVCPTLEYVSSVWDPYT